MACLRLVFRQMKYVPHCQVNLWSFMCFHARKDNWTLLGPLVPIFKDFPIQGQYQPNVALN